MTIPSPNWFSVSEPDDVSLNCAACGEPIELQDLHGDHHPRICPGCGRESLFLDWEKVTIQIVMELAPPVVIMVLRFLQEELDELEFVELIVHLEELSKTLKQKSLVGNSAQSGFEK